MKKILVICSLSVTIAANAANHYIRAGATGANNGTDWSNAWTTLPGSYVRGDTYYVADGTYVGNFVFSTPESGSALITFKKAVPFDHGTATGWSDAFGAGQSVFSATSGIVIRPQTGYWVFDGQVGSGDGSAARHGFKFATSDTANPCIYVINNYLVRFLTFSHVEVQGHGWYQGTDNTPLFENNSTAACSNFTFQSCYFHDCGGGWITSHQNAPNVLIEHCYFRNAGSGNPSFHMAGVILYGRQSGMNVTVRYNAFENVGSIGGSGYLCLGDDATSVTSDGYDVYGNVFFSTSANEGPGLYVVGNASADVVTGVRIFNNTIYGMRNTSSFWFGHGGPTVVVSNNVWQACAISPTFNNCVEGNNLKNTGGATFLDPAKGNFHLVSDTSTKWIPLASPFDRDADGLTRLSSIGAYQFGSGVISSNRPPVVSAGSDQTITLPNSVVLAGTASDPDGNVMTVSWTTVSGPAGVTLSAANVLRPTATFSASGIYTFRLAASDGSLSAIDEVVVTVNPQSTTGSTLAFEAESGLISAPFTVTSGYISQTIDSQLSMSTGGRAVYNFSISEAGDYRIKAVVNAPSAAENSFFVNVDADPQDPTMIWDVPVTTGFEDRWVSLRGTGTFDNNQFSPMTFSLASGPHQLIVIGREPNAQLDRLDVSKVPAPPTQLRLAQLP